MKSFSFFIISYFLFCFAGCDRSINNTQKNTDYLMFYLFEPDAILDPKERIEDLKHWNEKQPNQNGAFAFAHPNNKEMLTKIASAGIASYEAKPSELGSLWRNIVEQNKPKKLILFIETHGQEENHGKETRGNLCYQSQNNCNFGPDLLLNSLKQLFNTSLEHVLIIPLSCYNKHFMERFSALAKEIARPFKVSYLSLDNETECAGSFAAKSLLENKVLYDASDETLSRYYEIDDLSKMIGFLNEIFTRHKGNEEILYGMHHLFTPSSPLKLRDFGFDMAKAVVQVEDKCCQKNSFFDNIPVINYLDKYNLFKTNRYKISEFYFGDQEYVLPINGNMSTKIDISKIPFAGNYCNLFIKFFDQNKL